MISKIKFEAFDYVVTRLLEWYEKETGNLVNNDLSKLKVSKLLFFVTAVTTSINNDGLLKVFDKFSAMPYGHFESDIQDHMHESERYDISNRNAILRGKKTSFGFFKYNDIAIRTEIDLAIEKLKEINNDLITYDSFKLVDINHKWQSWRTVFSIAKRNGKLSMSIPHTIIKSENKIFF